MLTSDRVLMTVTTVNCQQPATSEQIYRHCISHIAFTAVDDANKAIEPVGEECDGLRQVAL